MARKKAASAALERERLRRGLDANARQRLKNLKSENMQVIDSENACTCPLGYTHSQIARDEEEKKLFSEAYVALAEAREDFKVKQSTIDD